MKISELEDGEQFYTQLGSRVLAVLCRRVDGWCVYIDAVPGYCHDDEWQAVAAQGTKAPESVAKAIAASLFHPGFEADVPYAL